MSYDRERDRPLPATEPVRLLPWASADGKPCYLRAGDEPGPVSRLADEAEEDQIRAGSDALAHAGDVLGDPTAGPLALRVALRRAATALGDVLRVADSRGARLSLADDGAERERR